MNHNSHMSKKGQLLIVISLLIVALGLGVFFIFQDEESSENILTAKQLSRYEEGTFYRTSVTSTVQGQIIDQDWGLEKTVTLVHEGETDVVREVISVQDKHQAVVVGLEVLKARDLEVRLALDDVKLDMPPAVGVISRAARKVALPGYGNVAAEIASERVSQWLRSEENRQRVLAPINSAVEAATGKGIEDYLLAAKMQPLEAYEGLEATYTYEAGEGLVDFQTQAVLSKEQEERVKNFSVYSEAYLMPDPDANGPKEWDVDVKNIAHLLAPQGELQVSGTLTLKRGLTTEGITRLEIVKGKVIFSGASDRNKVLGTWAARGALNYDLSSHSIRDGNLTGAVSLERTSTDHILFAEKFATTPSYRVVIHGYATTDANEARREIENLKQPL